MNKSAFSVMSGASLGKRLFGMVCLGILIPQISYAAQSSPEVVLRAIVQANAEKDLPRMERLFSHDSNLLGYGIGGRKYVGWDELARDMRDEFESITRLEIPIRDLHVWTSGDVAWFVMELDYIRHSPVGLLTDRLTLHLRETGVLERRDGDWRVVSWHTSPRYHSSMGDLSPRTPTNARHQVSQHDATEASNRYHLKGEWEVLEIEENRTYRATLDENGHGPYTWQGGTIPRPNLKIAGGKEHGRNRGMIERAALNWSYPKTGQRRKAFGGTRAWERGRISLPDSTEGAICGNA